MRSVLFLACVLAASSAAAQRKPVDVKAGERERWLFTAADKPIGSQTATCKAVAKRDGRTVSDWTVKVALSLEVGGQPIQLTMDGGFAVTDMVEPVSLNLSVTGAGPDQTARFAFPPGKARLEAVVGGRKQTKEVARKGDEVLQVNNVITLLNLTMRSVRPEPGKDTSVPVFATNMMQRVEFTLRCDPKTETLTIGGTPVECVVVDVAPIQHRCWVRKDSGELERIEVASQKLVIARQPLEPEPAPAPAK